MDEMLTFRLILANDDVGDGGPRFQDEDGVFFSSFILTLTFTA